MRARTIAEARAAGSLFNVDGLTRYGQCFPAAETVSEAVLFSVGEWWRWELARVARGEAPAELPATVEVWRHLPQSRIGCEVLEAVGTFSTAEPFREVGPVAWPSKAA